MKVSVVVPVYNRPGLIEKCVKSVLNQSQDIIELIIVDDGSTDKTKDVLARLAGGKVKVISNKSNYGPAYSRNKAITQAQGEIIAFTDSDCTADKNWLRELVKPFFDQSVQITAGRVIDHKPRHYWEIVNAGGDFVAHKAGFVKRAIGCNMAARRDFLAKNHFDERIPYAAAEEWDLCLRCLKKEGNIFYNPLAKVMHYRRSGFKLTMVQQFHYGFYNTYVSIKNKKFPYINYGSWILLGSWGTFLLSLGGNVFFKKVSGILLFVYLILVFYISMTARAKTFGEAVITFPSFLVRCFANFAGNMYYLYRIFVKKDKGSIV